VGALNQDASRDINTPVNNLTSNTGTYVSSLANGFAPRFVMTSDAAYLDGNFATGGLSHDLTIGTAGYRAQSYSVSKPATAAGVLLGSASVDSPQVFPFPAAGLPNTGLNYDSSTTYQQGINLGDTIRFTKAWSARVGVSQDWFHVDNQNAKAVSLPGYSDHGLSPAGSVLFKPLGSMTTYLTYASSLQAGDLAPGTAANAGAGLAPYRSKEYELGAKATFGKVDLTAALFRIERPFANIDPIDKMYKISGEQINKGLELSVVGEVLNGLTVYGGVTLLNAKLEHTPLVQTNDKLYVGAPKVKGNTLFEYHYSTIPGLVTSFDWQFTGARAGNDTNSFAVAGYNLFDVGARYTSAIKAKPVTWRLAVDNVADRYYWSTVGPSNLTGANTGTLLAHLGSPRTVRASVGVDF
jgi:iron complex outermembrane receptor protein